MATAKQIGRRIVDLIISDLSDRRGLGQEWDQIGSDIKQEIIEEWANIVEKAIKETKLDGV